MVQLSDRLDHKLSTVGESQLTMNFPAGQML